MNRLEQTTLAHKISAVTIFRSVIKSKPLSVLVSFLLTDEKDTFNKINLFADFVSSLSQYNYNFSDFLCEAISCDENPYIVAVSQGKSVDGFISTNALKELSLFSELSELNSKQLCSKTDFCGYVPEFSNNKTDFIKFYKDRIENITCCGYGLFATSAMFRLSDGKIVPVKTADKISSDNFTGYDEQRKSVFENTANLCNGKPSANVLLYGDAGTGKSSTVKACANFFYNKGVRLIEMRKDQIFSLPYVMDCVKNNPLKFIIFIDDLSFNKNDDTFSMLKAALEGSASAKAENTVIYATSNRRHIVKESFAERANGDDVHINDTIQELMSLSDRFGLTVYFEKPNKKLFLEIVSALADKKGIKTDRQQLSFQAEVYALSRGGRSPRIAEQFINSIK